MIQHKCVRLILNPAVVLGFVLLAGCGGGGYGGGDGGGGGGDGGYGSPPPPPAPTITLTPPTGASVNRTVNLSADVSATAGVTRVEFLVDGTIVGTTTASPYTFAWDTSAVADGAHGVAARVTDAASNVVTSGTVNVTVNNAPTINFALVPDEIFPRPNSTGSGSGTLVFGLINGAITGKLKADIQSTRASIHQGYAGAAGPAIVDFVRNAANPLQWDAAPGSMLTFDQIGELLRGRLYVKVSSTLFPNGELRGQLQPENIEVVFTAMSGNAAVPPNTIDASGLAGTTLDLLHSNLAVHVNTTGADDATQAHIGKAAVGANSTNLFALTQLAGVPSHWSVEVFSTEPEPITAQDRTEFTNGNWYVEVVTPRGAIRGQILPNAPFPTEPAVTLSQLQSTIFGPICSTCHSGTGTTLPGSMNLSSAAASFAALVNQPSVQQPTLKRVALGNPDDSYLVRKLEGTAGISGGRMPLGGLPPDGRFLDSTAIGQVRDWIMAGAAR